MTHSVAFPSPSPYQQPFPVPLQGKIRKNRMDRNSSGLTGLSPIRSRNHSYGGGPGGSLGTLQLGGGKLPGHLPPSGENSITHNNESSDLKMPAIGTPTHLKNKSQLQQKLSHLRNKSSARLNSIIMMGNNNINNPNNLNEDLIGIQD